MPHIRIQAYYKIQACRPTIHDAVDLTEADDEYGPDGLGRGKEDVVTVVAAVGMDSLILKPI